MFRRNKRRVPMLNTAATADMSFMLLIFFLVTTSMDADKGIERRLPPLDEKHEEQRLADINASNIMCIELMPNDSLTIDDEPADISTLRRQVMAFVGSNATDRQKHVISLRVDRAATYNAYFNVQNEIVAAYNTLRNDRALSVYGHSWGNCSPAEKAELRDYYPQRVAEAYDTAEEGGRP